MTEKEKFEYLLKLGWVCNPINGEVRNSRGKICKWINKNGYQTIGQNVNSTRCLAHRFIWFVYYGYVPKEIDHINKNRSDNRISNLREVTHQQNSFNTNAKGYHWNKRDKKYCSQIRINGKLIHLGYFETEEEAKNAYLKAKETYHMIKNP